MVPLNTDNPCVDDNPKLMAKVGAAIDRNRMHSRGNTSAETSPLASLRTDRGKPRIIEVSYLVLGFLHSFKHHSAKIRQAHAYHDQIAPE